MDIPDDLTGLLAKSDGETLVEHTWHVLARLADQAHLRPQMRTIVGSPRLWHRLYWAGLLHDFGKAVPGFQQMLRSNGTRRWPHRHEVASLAFVGWLFPDPHDDDYRWVVATIVSHHKDAATIAELYKTDGPAIREVATELAHAPLELLWRWLDGYAHDWPAQLGLAQNGVEPLALLPQAPAVRQVREHGVALIEQALKQYRVLVEDLRRPTQRRLYSTTIALRGLMINADHSASAHTGARPVLGALRWQDIVQRLGWTVPGLYEHQRTSAATTGHVLLNAPTGSGKTEAGIFWSFGDGAHPVPRLFYALPFQASMNAMLHRLERLFPGQVGLQHGRALQALYRRYVEEGDDPRRAVARASAQHNRTTLNYFPVRVFSPYQMLKGCYKLRGFETILADFFGATFIFDEIHAYEPERLALILRLMHYLSAHYDARFFVMSATFPELIKGALREAIGDYTEITASPDLFIAFQRHRLQLLDGEILQPASLDRIVAEAQAGRSVLVCCNTVARAQAAWRGIKARLEPAAVVVLLHSRLTTHDRLTRERQVMEACGLESSTRHPVVLVATQVVEVSLNIDLDGIYTDPAPLEALIQRFGRINRGRKQPAPAPVYVFRGPIPEQDRRPYDLRLLTGTLRLLEEHNGAVIAEDAVSNWLNTIYEQYAGSYAAEWRQTVAQQYAAFQDDVLASLVAFNADDDLARLFYQAFDSIEVLPARFEQTYFQLTSAERYVEASALLVSIAYWQYAALERAGKVRARDRTASDPLERIAVTTAVYDDDLGLLLWDMEGV